MKYMYVLAFVCLAIIPSYAQDCEIDIDVRGVECTADLAIITTRITCRDTTLIEIRSEEDVLDTLLCSTTLHRVDSLPVNGDLYKSLTYRAIEISDCDEEVVIPLPCSDDTCGLSDMSVEYLYCIDGDVFVNVDLEVGEGLSGNCIFTSDDNIFSQVVAYDDLPVILGPIPRITAGSQGLLASDQNDPSCKTFGEFLSWCEPLDCSDQFVMTGTSCEGYNSFISFSLDCTDTTYAYRIASNDGFNFVEGEFTDTIVSFRFGVPSASPRFFNWELWHWTPGGPDTCIQVFTPSVPCLSCTEGIMTVSEVSCNDDSTMSLTVDMEHPFLGQSLLLTNRIGQYLGKWQVWEFPVTIHGVVPTPGEEQFLIVPIDDECGFGERYPSPDCVTLPCNAQEFDVTEFQCDDGNIQLAIAPADELLEGDYDVFIDDVFLARVSDSGFPVLTDPIRAIGQNIAIDVVHTGTSSQECNNPFTHRISFCTTSTADEQVFSGAKIHREGDIVRIQFDKPTELRYELALMSIIGQSFDEVIVPSSSTQVEFDMSDIPSGVYFVTGVPGRAIKFVY